MILTKDIAVDDLLRKVQNIGDQLKGYTEKLVFSYADIGMYRKVKHNLEVNGIPYREWQTEQMEAFAENGASPTWGTLRKCAAYRLFREV